MLDAGRAPQQIAGLTLFHDHADPACRYVLCDVPRLVRRPGPQLALWLYRGPQAGALLQFEAQLAPSDAQLAAAERELARDGPAPRLVRPDWRSGTLRLAGWLQADALAPLQLASGMPSLVGDPNALISARLDAAGAALADAALRGNALPTVLIFELETLGLAGALEVEVEADLQALHDRLSVEGALTTPYGRARIAATWEEALRDRTIRVRVLDQSGDVEGRRAEAMRRVGEDLIGRLFSVVPPAELPAQTGDEAVAPLELSFRLTARREELQTTAHWDLRERRAVRVRHIAAASLVGLLGDSPAEAHIHAVDLDAPSREFVVRAEPELGWLGIAALEVDLGDETGVRRSLVLTDANPEDRSTWADARPDRFRVRARYDPMRQAAADAESAWLDAPDGLAAVSARRLFPPRALTLIAGRVEFEWLDHVELRVAAGDAPPQVLRLSTERSSGELCFPAGAAPLRLEAVWRGQADEPQWVEAPRPVDEGVVVLDSPFAPSLAVLALPLPLPGIATIVLELRSECLAFTQTRSLAWDVPDRRPQRVALRLPQGGARRYAWRVQQIHDDGSLETGPWTDSERSTLVIGRIGEPAPSQVRQLELVLLGGVGARGALAIEAVLEAGDEQSRDLIEAPREGTTLALTQAPGSRARLRLREFLEDGSVRESAWDDPPALLVLEPSTSTE